MYTGPFVVEARSGPVNYRIRKSPHSRPLTVHVDKLRACFREEPMEDVEAPEPPADDASEVSGRPRRETRRPARYQ